MIRPDLAEMLCFGHLNRLLAFLAEGWGMKINVCAWPLARPNITSLEGHFSVLFSIVLGKTFTSANLSVGVLPVDRIGWKNCRTGNKEGH
jgi:hypothetical protein